VTASRKRNSRTRSAPKAQLVAAVEHLDASVLVVDDEKMISKVVGRGLIAAG